MRTAFTLFFTLISTLSVVGQDAVDELINALEHPLRIKTNETQGESAVATHLYTRDLQDYRDGEFVTTSQWFYSYNDSGQLTGYKSWFNDNDTWRYSRRKAYEYNSSGSVTREVDENWNQNLLRWDPYYTYFFEYDENERLLVQTYHKYYSGNQELFPERRYTYAYDENGKVILHERDEWSLSFGWYTTYKRIEEFAFVDKQLKYESYSRQSHGQLLRGANKYDHSYDQESQERLSRVDFKWNDDANNWEENTYTNYYRIGPEQQKDSTFVFDTEELIRYSETSLNEHENILSIIRYNKSEAGIFYKDFEETRSYDEAQNVTERITSAEGWDGEFKYRRRENREYDAAGNNTLSAYFEWDNNLNEWHGENKYHYEYDGNGNAKIHEGFKWDSDIADWIPWFKEICYFNEASLPTFGAVYWWDNELNEFVGSRKLEIEYDEFNRVLTEVKSTWDSDVNDWVYDFRYINHYNEYKQPQVIQLENLDFVHYGDTLLLEADATSGLEVAFEVLQAGESIFGNDTLIIKGMSEIIIRASQPGNDVYDHADDVMLKLAPKKAALIAKADNQSIIEGATIPEYTISYEGFLFDDDTSTIVQPSTHPPNTDGNVAGEYEIILYYNIADEEVSDKYIVELVPGTLTVSEKPLGLKEDSFILFPNPTAGHFEISGSIDFTFIRLISTDGKSSDLLERSKANIYKVDSFDDGNYFVLFLDDLHKMIGVRRLVISRNDH